MNNKASLVKVNKTHKTKMEMATQLVKIFCALKNVHLSETQTTVLVYFMLYGINNETKDLIINSKICKNRNVVKGNMVALRKAGFIYKDDLNDKNYVAEELSFNLTSTVGLYIKLNINNDDN